MTAFLHINSTRCIFLNRSQGFLNRLVELMQNRNRFAKISSRGLALCCTCPTNWPGPQKQSNNQIWKMGRGTKQTPGQARKQSKRASEQSKRAPEQSKMTKNNPKTSKTIKNHTGAAFGGAPGARSAPGSDWTSRHCFGSVLIVLGPVWIVLRPFLIVSWPALGSVSSRGPFSRFDCLIVFWGPPS